MKWSNIKRMVGPTKYHKQENKQTNLEFSTLLERRLHCIVHNGNDVFNQLGVLLDNNTKLTAHDFIADRILDIGRGSNMSGRQTSHRLHDLCSSAH